MPYIRPLNPGESPLAFLGSEVRRARERRDPTMSQADLAALIPCHPTVVSKVECAELEPTEAFAAGCDRAFPEMGGFFLQFLDHFQQWTDAGVIPPWFRDWVDQEDQAKVIRQWEPLLVPGLFQTPDYARAVLGWQPDDDGAVDGRVAARLERQRIFDRDSPPEVWLLLRASVLSRSADVGGVDVMRGQVDHLLKMAQRPHVTIQIVPDEARANGGLSGAFALASVGASDAVLYLETGVRGLIFRDPTLVERAVYVFEHLRAEALSRSQTIQFLSRTGEKWNA